MAGGWWAWLHNLAVLRLTIDAALFYVKSIVLLSLVVLDGGTCPASALDRHQVRGHRKIHWQLKDCGL
jgi:hypothetical protein